MDFAVEKNASAFPRKWFWVQILCLAHEINKKQIGEAPRALQVSGWPSRAPSCCMGCPIPWVSPGGARWRVQHLWRQWYGASELHGSWDSGSVWTVFFWGKHGRGYIDFNYATYVYIFINLIFIHIYLFCSPLCNYIRDLAVEKRNLVSVGMMHIPSCSTFHTSQDDACFRLDQQYHAHFYPTCMVAEEKKQ